MNWLLGLFNGFVDIMENRARQELIDLYDGAALLEQYAAKPPAASGAPGVRTGLPLSA